MTTLQFNPGYIKAIEEIIVKQSLYENGVELPLIARKFIEDDAAHYYYKTYKK